MRNQPGMSRLTSRLPIATVQSSWNAPWLRKLVRKSFRLLDSTSQSPGA
jgi:hypothetical protein